MIDNKEIYNDDKMKELLSGSKLSASENLQHRIMQQIMTEKALTPQRVKSTKPILRIVVIMAIAMYLIVMGVGSYAYITGGITALTSKEFIIPVLTLTSICAVCGLVTILDEKRYQR